MRQATTADVGDWIESWHAKALQALAAGRDDESVRRELVALGAPAEAAALIVTEIITLRGRVLRRAARSNRQVGAIFALTGAGLGALLGVAPADPVIDWLAFPAAICLIYGAVRLVRGFRQLVG